MAALDTTVTKAAKLPEYGKSFVQALSGTSSYDDFLTNPPPKVVLVDSVRIKISQAAYESGLAACRFNFHGRLTLHKGDAPLTTLALNQSSIISSLNCIIGI